MKPKTNDRKSVAKRLPTTIRVPTTPTPEMLKAMFAAMLASSAFGVPSMRLVWEAAITAATSGADSHEQDMIDVLVTTLERIQKQQGPTLKKAKRPKRTATAGRKATQ